MKSYRALIVLCLAVLFLLSPDQSQTGVVNTVGITVEQINQARDRTQIYISVSNNLVNAGTYVQLNPSLLPDQMVLAEEAREQLRLAFLKHTQDLQAGRLTGTKLEILRLMILPPTGQSVILRYIPSDGLSVLVNPSVNSYRIQFGLPPAGSNLPSVAETLLYQGSSLRAVFGGLSLGASDQWLNSKLWMMNFLREISNDFALWNGSGPEAWQTYFNSYGPPAAIAAGRAGDDQFTRLTQKIPAFAEWTLSQKYYAAAKVYIEKSDPNGWNASQLNEFTNEVNQNGEAIGRDLMQRILQPVQMADRIGSRLSTALMETIAALHPTQFPSLANALMVNNSAEFLDFGRVFNISTISRYPEIFKSYISLISRVSLGSDREEFLNRILNSIKSEIQTTSGQALTAVSPSRMPAFEDALRDLVGLGGEFARVGLTGALSLGGLRGSEVLQRVLTISTPSTQLVVSQEDLSRLAGKVLSKVSEIKSLEASISHLPGRIATWGGTSRQILAFVRDQISARGSVSAFESWLDDQTFIHMLRIFRPGSDFDVAAIPSESASVEQVDNMRTIVNRTLLPSTFFEHLDFGMIDAVANIMRHYPLFEPGSNVIISSNGIETPPELNAIVGGQRVNLSALGRAQWSRGVLELFENVEGHLGHGPMNEVHNQMQSVFRALRFAHEFRNVVVAESTIQLLKRIVESWVTPQNSFDFRQEILTMNEVTATNPVIKALERAQLYSRDPRLTREDFRRVGLIDAIRNVSPEIASARIFTPLYERPAGFVGDPSRKLGRDITVFHTTREIGSAVNVSQGGLIQSTEKGIVSLRNMVTHQGDGFYVAETLSGEPQLEWGNFPVRAHLNPESFYASIEEVTENPTLLNQVDLVYEDIPNWGRIWVLKTREGFKKNPDGSLAIEEFTEETFGKYLLGSLRNYASGVAVPDERLVAILMGLSSLFDPSIPSPTTNEIKALLSQIRPAGGFVEFYNILTFERQLRARNVELSVFENFVSEVEGLGVLAQNNSVIREVVAKLTRDFGAKVPYITLPLQEIPRLAALVGRLPSEYAVLYMQDAFVAINQLPEEVLEHLAPTVSLFIDSVFNRALIHDPHVARVIVLNSAALGMHEVVDTLDYTVRFINSTYFNEIITSAEPDLFLGNLFNELSLQAVPNQVKIVVEKIMASGGNIAKAVTLRVISENTTYAHSLISDLMDTAPEILPALYQAATTVGVSRAYAFNQKVIHEFGNRTVDVSARVFFNSLLPNDTSRALIGTLFAANPARIYEESGLFANWISTIQSRISLGGLDYKNSEAYLNDKNSVEAVFENLGALFDIDDVDALHRVPPDAPVRLMMAVRPALALPYDFRALAPQVNELRAFQPLSEALKISNSALRLTKFDDAMTSIDMKTDSGLPAFRKYSLSTLEISELTPAELNNFFRTGTYSDPNISTSEYVESFISRIQTASSSHLADANLQSFFNFLRSAEPHNPFLRALLGVVNQALEQRIITVEFRPDALPVEVEEELLADGSLFRSEVTYSGQNIPQTFLTGRHRIILGRPSPLVGSPIPGLGRSFSISDQHLHELLHFYIMVENSMGRNDWTASNVRADIGPQLPWGEIRIPRSVSAWSNEVLVNYFLFRNLAASVDFVSGSGGLEGSYPPLEGWLVDVYAGIDSTSANVLRQSIQALPAERKFWLGERLSEMSFLRSPRASDSQLVWQILNYAERPDFNPLHFSGAQPFARVLEGEILSQRGLTPSGLRELLSTAADIPIDFGGRTKGVSLLCQEYLISLGWEPGFVQTLGNYGFRVGDWLQLLSSPDFLGIHGFVTHLNASSLLKEAINPNQTEGIRTSFSKLKAIKELFFNEIPEVLMRLNRDLPLNVLEARQIRQRNEGIQYAKSLTQRVADLDDISALDHLIRHSFNNENLLTHRTALGRLILKIPSLGSSGQSRLLQSLIDNVFFHPNSRLLTAELATLIELINPDLLPDIRDQILNLDHFKITAENDIFHELVRNPNNRSLILKPLRALPGYSFVFEQSAIAEGYDFRGLVTEALKHFSPAGTNVPGVVRLRNYWMELPVPPPQLIYSLRYIVEYGAHFSFLLKGADDPYTSIARPGFELETENDVRMVNIAGTTPEMVTLNLVEMITQIEGAWPKGPLKAPGNSYAILTEVGSKTAEELAADLRWANLNFSIALRSTYQPGITFANWMSVARARAEAVMTSSAGQSLPLWLKTQFDQLDAAQQYIALAGMVHLDPMAPSVRVDDPVIRSLVENLRQFTERVKLDLVGLRQNLPLPEVRRAIDEFRSKELGLSDFQKRLGSILGAQGVGWSVPMLLVLSEMLPQSAFAFFDELSKQGRLSFIFEAGKSGGALEKYLRYLLVKYKYDEIMLRRIVGEHLMLAERMLSDSSLLYVDPEQISVHTVEGASDISTATVKLPNGDSYFVQYPRFMTDPFAFPRSLEQNLQAVAAAGGGLNPDRRIIVYDSLDRPVIGFGAPQPPGFVSLGTLNQVMVEGQKLDLKIKAAHQTSLSALESSFESKGLRTLDSLSRMYISSSGQVYLGAVHLEVNPNGQFAFTAARDCLARAINYPNPPPVGGSLPGSSGYVPGGTQPSLGLPGTVTQLLLSDPIPLFGVSDSEIISRVRSVIDILTPSPSNRTIYMGRVDAMLSSLQSQMRTNPYVNVVLRRIAAEIPKIEIRVDAQVGGTRSFMSLQPNGVVRLTIQRPSGAGHGGLDTNVLRLGGELVLLRSQWGLMPREMELPLLGQITNPGPIVVPTLQQFFAKWGGAVFSNWRVGDEAWLPLSLATVEKELGVNLIDLLRTHFSANELTIISSLGAAGQLQILTGLLEGSYAGNVSYLSQAYRSMLVQTAQRTLPGAPISTIAQGTHPSQIPNQRARVLGSIQQMLNGVGDIVFFGGNRVGNIAIGLSPQELRLFLETGQLADNMYRLGIYNQSINTLLGDVNQARGNIVAIFNLPPSANLRVESATTRWIQPNSLSFNDLSGFGIIPDTAENPIGMMNTMLNWSSDVKAAGGVLSSRATSFFSELNGILKTATGPPLADATVRTFTAATANAAISSIRGLIQNYPMAGTSGVPIGAARAFQSVSYVQSGGQAFKAALVPPSLNTQAFLDSIVTRGGRDILVEQISAQMRISSSVKTLVGTIAKTQAVIDVFAIAGGSAGFTAVDAVTNAALATNIGKHIGGVNLVGPQIQINVLTRETISLGSGATRAYVGGVSVGGSPYFSGAAPESFTINVIYKSTPVNTGWPWAETKPTYSVQQIVRGNPGPQSPVATVLLQDNPAFQSMQLLKARASMAMAGLGFTAVIEGGLAAGSVLLQNRGHWDDRHVLKDAYGEFALGAVNSLMNPVNIGMNIGFALLPAAAQPYLLGAAAVAGTGAAIYYAPSAYRSYSQWVPQGKVESYLKSQIETNPAIAPAFWSYMGLGYVHDRWGSWEDVGTIWKHQAEANQLQRIKEILGPNSMGPALLVQNMLGDPVSSARTKLTWDPNYYSQQNSIRLGPNASGMGIGNPSSNPIASFALFDQRLMAQFPIPNPESGNGLLVDLFSDDLTRLRSGEPAYFVNPGQDPMRPFIVGPVDHQMLESYRTQDASDRAAISFIVSLGVSEKNASQLIPLFNRLGIVTDSRAHSPYAADKIIQLMDQRSALLALANDHGELGLGDVPLLIDTRSSLQKLVDGGYMPPSLIDSIFLAADGRRANEVIGQMMLDYITYSSPDSPLAMPPLSGTTLSPDLSLSLYGTPAQLSNFSFTDPSTWEVLDDNFNVPSISASMVKNYFDEPTGELVSFLPCYSAGNTCVKSGNTFFINSVEVDAPAQFQPPDVVIPQSKFNQWLDDVFRGQTYDSILRDLTDKVVELREKIAKAMSKIQKHAAKIVEIDSKISVLKEKVSNLTSKIAHFAEKASAIRKIIENISNKIGNLIDEWLDLSMLLGICEIFDESGDFCQWVIEKMTKVEHRISNQEELSANQSSKLSDIESKIQQREGKLAEAMSKIDALYAKREKKESKIQKKLRKIKEREGKIKLIESIGDRLVQDHINQVDAFNRLKAQSCRDAVSAAQEYIDQQARDLQLKYGAAPSCAVATSGDCDIRINCGPMPDIRDRPVTDVRSAVREGGFCRNAYDCEQMFNFCDWDGLSDYAGCPNVCPGAISTLSPTDQGNADEVRIVGLMSSEGLDPYEWLDSFVSTYPSQCAESAPALTESSGAIVGFCYQRVNTVFAGRKVEERANILSCLRILKHCVSDSDCEDIFETCDWPFVMNRTGCPN